MSYSITLPQLAPSLFLQLWKSLVDIMLIFNEIEGSLYQIHLNVWFVTLGSYFILGLKRVPKSRTKSGFQVLAIKQDCIGAIFTRGGSCMPYPVTVRYWVYMKQHLLLLHTGETNSHLTRNTESSYSVSVITAKSKHQISETIRRLSNAKSNNYFWLDDNTKSCLHRNINHTLAKVIYPYTTRKMKMEFTLQALNSGGMVLRFSTAYHFNPCSNLGEGIVSPASSTMY